MVKKHHWAFHSFFNIASLIFIFYIFAALYGLWDLSSLTRDQNHAPSCSGNTQSQSLDLREVPLNLRPTASRDASGKEPSCPCKRQRRCKFDPWVRKIPWRRKWQPTPVFLPGESHGPRSLAGYSPWGCTGSDRTEATQHTCTHAVACGPVSPSSTVEGRDVLKTS